MKLYCTRVLQLDLADLEPEYYNEDRKLNHIDLNAQSLRMKRFQDHNTGTH
jgi:hypothetical protein